MLSSKIKQSGYKILSGIIAATSIVTFFSPVITPIYAADDGSDLTATSSGNTSGNKTNTIAVSSSCDGTDKLSGTDAEVFKKLTPESDGDIICAKSDGFRTEVTGTSDVKNYHWTAWYKNNQDDEPDKTNDLGNYRGFNKSKVEQWQSYREEIEGLNNGAFPELKDYTYPTDTSTNKLDFWGDIAGYYSVLGDPQYKSIHLTAYQQFSYKTKHVVQRTEIIPAPTPSYTGGGSIGKGNSSGGYVSPSNGTYSNGTSSGAAGSKNNSTSNKYSTSKKNPSNCKQRTVTMRVGGKKRKITFTDCGGSNIWFGGSVLGYNSSNTTNSETSTIDSNEMLGKITKTEHSNGNLASTKNVNGAIYKTYEDITYSWETQEVKVAEADLSSGTYATEFAAMPKLSLKAGSGNTYTVSTNNSGFWQTIPRYWTDGGKSTITNTSSLPYHFESEATGGVGVNTVNVYTNLNEKDKLYSLVHGYPNITEIPNIPGVPGTPSYPGNQDETCTEVDNNTVCSKKETPVIKIEINLDDDNPQGLEEVDKRVHLVKNQETQADIKRSKEK